MNYQENIFTKILKGEIKPNIVMETSHSLVFYDIQPKAEIHLLVIPKGKYVDFTDFLQANKEERDDFFWTIGKVIEKMDLSDGYRLITNSGIVGQQEVSHFHVHILGKKIFETL